MSIIKKAFEIEGMHCGSCATGIQVFLSNTDGVKTATVDYNSKRGEVEYDDEKINEEEIVKGVGELGFKSKPID